MKATRTAKQSGCSLMMILALSFTVTVYAQAGSRSKGSSSKPRPDGEVIRVTVEGEHTALGQGSGTKGSGTKGGHTYGLRVIRAIGQDGQELSTVRGWVLNYRDTDQSRDLIKKHNPGEKLMVIGQLHIQQRMLEVESFTKPGASGSGSKGSGTKRRGSGSKSL